MPKILIIDAKQGNLSSVKALLQDLIPDCQVYTAQSGKKGHKIARKEQPDTILLDISMPEMDGYTVCEKLKEDGSTKHIPVIMLTALKTDSKSIKGLESGADAFLSKPIDPQELKAQVNVMLRIKAAEDKLRAEKELLDETATESEEKYRALYNNAPLSYQSLDENGRFLDVNPAWLRTLGYNREEAIGKWFGDFLHPDWKAYFEKNFQEFKRRGYGHDIQFKIRHKDGHYLDILFEGRIGYTPDGSFKQAYCVFQDITERLSAEQAGKQAERKLHEAATQWQTTFDAMSDSVSIIDNDGYFVQCNSATLKMLGISDQEIKGKQCWQLVHGLSEPFENCPIVRMKKSKQPESMIFQEGDRWLEVSVDPIFDDTGQIKGAVHVVSDVTKRKKAKEALYESERKYRKLVENIEEGIASVDENEKFIYVNHAAIKIFGYSEKELLKKSLKDLSTSNEYKRIIEQTSIRKTGKTSRYELNIIKKNGTNAIISVTSSPLFDSHKKYLGAFGIFSDITERKQAEEALRESEEKYKMMFETVKDAVFISDENGKFMDVNQMACESLRYSKEELLKLSNKEIDADPRGYEAFLEIRNGTKEKVTFEVNQRRKDGTLLPVEITGSFFTSGGQRIALAIARDITKRLSAEQAGKQAEEDIRRSAAYTRSLIEASLDPLVTIDPGGKITDVNKAIEIATGRTRKEIIGSDFSNYFTEPAKAKEGYKQVFKKGIVRDYSLEIKHKNGSVISVLYNASLYKDESGKVIGIFAAARDITKHKKAEDKLERLSRQNELILNSINEGIYGVDMQGNTTFINPAVESITGFGTKELIGHHQHDILHYLKPDGSHYPSEECPIYMAFKDGLVHHVTDEIFWRKNGTSFPVEYTATPIRKQGKIVGSVVVFRDITGRKKMEEEKETLEYQLRQSQKLESIGTLAGGVAHDFNNLLTIIQGRTQLLLLDTNENDPKSRDLRQILDASTRAASLTRQLLLFSRKETMEMKTVNLNQTINNLLKMLNRLIGEDLSVKTILTPELWSVEADEGNLEQVIMNLTVNARDAMPDGGILTIQTENLQLSEKDCKIIPESNTGHFVRLMIEDTGTGIPKDIIDKIFDPFFSTKAVGKGVWVYRSFTALLKNIMGGSMYIVKLTREPRSRFTCPRPNHRHRRRLMKKT